MQPCVISEDDPFDSSEPSPLAHPFHHRTHSSSSNLAVDVDLYAVARSQSHSKTRRVSQVVENEEALNALRSSLRSISSNTTTNVNTRQLTIPTQQPEPDHAHSFNQLLAEMRSLEASLADKERDCMTAGEIGSLLLEKNERANVRIDELQLQLDRYEEENATLINEHKLMQRKLARLDSLTHQQAQQIDDANSTIAQLSGELSTLKKTHHHYQQSLKTNDEQKTDLQIVNEELTHKLEQVSKQCHSANATIVALQHDMHTLRHDYDEDIADLTRRVEEDEKRIHALLTDNNKMKEKLTSASNSIDSELKWENEHLHSSLRGLQEVIDTLQASREEGERLLFDKNETIERLHAKLDTLDKHDRLSHSPTNTLADDVHEHDNHQQPNHDNNNQRASPTQQSAPPPSAIMSSARADDVSHKARTVSTLSISPSPPPNANPSPLITSSLSPSNASPLRQSSSSNTSSLFSLSPSSSSSSHASSSSLAPPFAVTKVSRGSVFANLWPASTSASSTAQQTSSSSSSSSPPSLTVSTSPAPPTPSKQSIPSPIMSPLLTLTSNSKYGSITNTPCMTTPLISTFTDTVLSSSSSSSSGPSIATSASSVPNSSDDAALVFLNHHHRRTSIKPSSSSSSSSSLSNNNHHTHNTDNDKSAAASVTRTSSMSSSARGRERVTDHPLSSSYSSSHSDDDSDSHNSPQRDAMKEFFSLSLLSLKINSGKKLDSLISLNSSELYKRACAQGIQFHQFQAWLTTEITKVYVENLYQQNTKHNNTHTHTQHKSIHSPSSSISSSQSQAKHGSARPTTPNTSISPSYTSPSHTSPATSVSMTNRTIAAKGIMR